MSAPGAGAVAVPFLVAIYWALNSSEKEKQRKGLHPATKIALWTFGIFTAIVGLIALAQVIGFLPAP